jgi:hypothetical protein
MKAREPSPKAPGAAPAKAVGPAPPSQAAPNAQAPLLSDDHGTHRLLEGVDGRGAARSELVDPGFGDILAAAGAGRSIAGSAIRLQRKAVGAPAVATAPVIIEDGAAPSAAQIAKRDWFAAVEPAIKAEVASALGPTWEVASCPYIAKFLAVYARRSAAEIERFVRRYTGSVAATPAGLMADLRARVRSGVEHWAQTGKPPRDLATADPETLAAVDAGPGAATNPPAVAAVQRKADAAAGDAHPAGSPEHVLSRLGEGARLDSTTASRMAGAFETSFDEVRLHTDDGGNALAREQGALAFTVGSHVAFAPGTYAPGTVDGDALLAHELTHVLQQRGAAPGAPHKKAPGSAEPGDAERDADAGAAAAVAQLHGAAALKAQRARATVSSGFQLQRCSGHPASSGLIGASFEGSFLRKKVGEVTVTVISVGTPSLTTEIHASRTLGAFDTEAAAIAVVKTNGRPGAVTIENAKFVAYETDAGFGYREVYVANLLGGTSTHHRPPKLAPGVIALISNELMTVRAGDFDPGATQDVQGTADVPMTSSADPFAGYRQALGDANGDLNGLPDDKLVAAFHAALKDTALVVLNKSSDEVKTKQGRFAQGGAGVSDSELDTMQQTAAQLAAVDVQIEAQQKVLSALERKQGAYDTALATGGSPVGGGYSTEIKAAQDQLQQVQTRRKVYVSQYPLLSRVDPAAFKTKTKDEMASQLGAELPGILKDIETTKQNVADGSINLWGIDQLVDATIAGFGLDADRRKVIMATRASEAKKKTIETVVFTVFAIGFGLAAVFATGGAALFFAAGAFGLSTYDALKQTEQYALDRPASNVNLDKDGGFAAAPGWGWLVMAWVGVGLDAAQVASAIGKAAKAGMTVEATIAEASKDLAANARRLGMTEEELLARLRKVAGEATGATRITEGSKLAMARRLGLPIDIDPRLVGDVRVYYQVDKTTGRVIVTGLAAGPEATLAEVLAHENVINLMRRYDGATGKLRELWEKLLALLGKSPRDANPFRAGSKAYDSWNELYKLPDVVNAQFLKYKGGVTAANESTLARDLEILEEEARRHRKIVDEMVLEAGDGFVAKTGDSTRAAVGQGYPLPPGARNAEDMLAQGYYYRAAADGGYEITRTSKAIGTQLRLDKATMTLVTAVEKLETRVPNAAQLARLRSAVTDDVRLATLLDKARTADRLESLLKAVGDPTRLEALLGKVHRPEDLEKLLTHLTASELEKFITDLGDVAKMKELAEKYGGDALKHYGPQFFKDFKGVDANTMRHLTTVDGIDQAKGIKGCHDEDLFVAEMKKSPDGLKAPPAGVERGPILSVTPRADPAIKDIKYSFWKQDGKGNLVTPLQPKAAVFEKTTIKDLATNPTRWSVSASEAADDAIRNLTFPRGDGSFVGVAKSGQKWKGWYRGGNVQTIFPEP